MSISDSATCVQRAIEHRDAALSLMAIDSEIGREWVAVCFFYSAYHRVRGAMMVDPVFGDATRLTRFSPRLTMEDRLASHHQGRKGAGLGVREIVPLLYPRIKREYIALHQASIDVRYGARLIAGLDDLRDMCDLIHDEGDAGRLVAVDQPSA